jgi:predicted DNA-binding ribbon-helix-helix protein
MKSSIVKRSIVLAGHKTSISLEDEFWSSLRDIARSGKTTLSQLIAGIDGQRNQGNLSSAVRLFVLGHFKCQTAMICQPQTLRREPILTAGTFGAR